MLVEFKEILNEAALEEPPNHHLKRRGIM